MPLNIYVHENNKTLIDSKPKTELMESYFGIFSNMDKQNIV